MLEKIRQIKYSRMKPEEIFLLDMIDGIQPFKSSNFQKSIFWGKDNEVLFEQDYENGWLRVSYKSIWSVFSSKYGYNYDEIQSFIKDVVNRHTNLGSLTPPYIDHSDNPVVNRHTNLGSLTPKILITPRLSSVNRHTNLGSLTPKLGVTVTDVAVNRHTNLGSLTPIAVALFKLN